MLTLALTALGAWCWPERRASDRVVPPSTSPRLATTVVSWFRRRAGWSPLLLLAAVAAGAVVAGPAGSCAASALVVTGRACHRFWSSQQRLARSWEELAGGLRLFIAQLRTGAHPAAAAEGASAEAPPAVACLFHEITTTAQLGGDVAEALLRTRAPPASASSVNAVSDDWLRRPRESMARCWSLAERHGAGLAELLDSVRRDLEAKATFHRRVHADMAGPRATAVVLTGLPILGIGLGEAAGAHPGSVLRASAGGQVLLLLGVGLLCAGSLWTVRLTAGGGRGYR